MHFCVFPFKASFAIPYVSLFIYFFKLKAPVSSKMKNQTNHISMYFVVSYDLESSEDTPVNFLVSGSWRTSS